MRSRETAELMETKRGERLAIGLSEVVADHDGEVQRFGNRLKATHKIDRGPYDREVEAVSGADIAIEDLSNMEGNHYLQGRLALQERVVAKLAQGFQ